MKYERFLKDFGLICIAMLICKFLLTIFSSFGFNVEKWFYYVMGYTVSLIINREREEK